MIPVTGSTFDVLPNGFLEVDAEDRVVVWNRVLEQWTGLKSSAVLEKGIAGRDHGDGSEVADDAESRRQRG